jgi:hypothetical protein
MKMEDEKLYDILFTFRRSDLMIMVATLVDIIVEGQNATKDELIDLIKNIRDELL